MPDHFPPSLPATPPSRALVLGGGGSTGNAWLIGVLAGLVEAGVDVAGADLVVGTSAGATAAAQFTNVAPAALLAAVLSAPVIAPPGGTATAPVTDQLDRLRALIASASGPDDLRRRIGAAALELDAASNGSWSARWRTTVAARLPQQGWPERAVVLTAIDARTGQAVLLDRRSGVDLADAVAASCASALPYRLGDRMLLDGAYRRGDNADIAAGHDRVLVLSPLGGRSLHPPAWRSHLAAQVEDLQAAGARVETVVPDSASEHLFGEQGMDLSQRPAAARAGHAQGLAIARRVSELWD